MPYYPHHSKNKWPVSDGVTKKCRKCLEIKPVSEFYKNRRERSDGLQVTCKPCSKASTYAYRETPKGRAVASINRLNHVMRRYGITEHQYNSMLESQNYVCAICGEPESHIINGATKRLAVDHCHATGKVRGLLCAHCNQAIGRLKDDPSLIRKAADYVERHMEC